MKIFSSKKHTVSLFLKEKKFDIRQIALVFWPGIEERRESNKKLNSVFTILGALWPDSHTGTSVLPSRATDIAAYNMNDNRRTKHSKLLLLLSLGLSFLELYFSIYILHRPLQTQRHHPGTLLGREWRCAGTRGDEKGAHLPQSCPEELKDHPNRVKFYLWLSALTHSSIQTSIQHNFLKKSLLFSKPSRLPLDT